MKNYLEKKNISKVLNIFACGWVILITAILVNVVAKQIGLNNWYDFILGTGKISAIDYVFLFAIYPAILGSAAYFYNEKMKRK